MLHRHHIRVRHDTSRGKLKRERGLTTTWVRFHIAAKVKVHPLHLPLCTGRYALPGLVHCLSQSGHAVAGLHAEFSRCTDRGVKRNKQRDPLSMFEDEALILCYYPAPCAAQPTEPTRIMWRAGRCLVCALPMRLSVPVS